MKKALCLLLALFLCLGLAACINPQQANALSAQSASSLPPAPTRLKFCASYPTLGSAFYGALNGAISNAVTAQDARLIPLDAGGDIAVQILQIEDMLTEGIDALFLAPVNPSGLRSLLESLRQQGVPVINIATRVEDEDLVDAILVPDGTAAGSLLAEDALQRLPEGGQVIVLEQPHSLPAVEAVSAWDAVIRGDAWPTAARWQLNNAQEASNLLSTFMQENPGGADVIFTTADSAAPGIVSALNTARVRPGTVLIYSIGGAPDAKRLVSDGWLTATAHQSPTNLGVQAVSTANQILSGNAPQKEGSLPTSLITAENIGEYSLDEWD